MYHRTTLAVRDLRYDFTRIESLLRQGEEIRITKRGKVLKSAQQNLSAERNRL